MVLLSARAPAAPGLDAHAVQLRPRATSLRTAAFFAAFTTATGVAARMGDAQVAAHQIGFQLWTLIALALDATAIAAQALIGRLLGAGAVDAAAVLPAGSWRRRAPRPGAAPCCSPPATT